MHADDRPVTDPQTQRLANVRGICKEQHPEENGDSVHEIASYPNAVTVARLLDNWGLVSFSPRQFAQLAEWVEPSPDMAAIDVRQVRFTLANEQATKPGVLASQGDEVLVFDVEGARFEYSEAIEVAPDRLPDHEAVNRIHAILSGRMWCGADDMPAIAEIVEATGRTIEPPADE